MWILKFRNGYGYGHVYVLLKLLLKYTTWKKRQGEKKIFQ
jgi:hypothetical protein